LDLVHPVGLSDFVGESVFVDLSLWILLQVEDKELPVIVVPSLEPANLGVVVGLPDQVLVGPVLLAEPLDGRLGIGLHWIVEVRQLEPIVVVPSVLPDA
jgi:hypothetical protein